ncbi:hypothetical protein SO802_021536 [Lithocarpus litseifolius]|uniref:G-patch domain-containing protein n=1 Tax=Lithocarpus litseifolius TaxID=425828 RepID=A0AAW2CIL0_9ROSI
MVKEGEHPNTEEPMNTQELLNTIVAIQIQLRENVNRMMQQFQNLKSNQEEDKTDHDPLAIESEKKINERMNNMEEMIRRARKMEDLMDYNSLSLLPNARLPPKFKMPTLDKFDGTGCPKSYLKMYMRAMHPLGTTEEVLAQMFQGTLTRATFRWFLNLDYARARRAIVTIYGDTFTVPKPVYGIDSEREPLTLDGIVIKRPISEKREGEVKKTPMDFAPYGNNNMVAMMRRMNYLPGMNLGRTAKKPTVQDLTIPTAISPFGLGYKPIDDDLLKMEMRKMARAKAKAKGLPCPPEPLKPL